jgi:hypothetical protein
MDKGGIILHRVLATKERNAAGIIGSLLDDGRGVCITCS